jgi:hypothetical protein
MTAAFPIPFTASRVIARESQPESPFLVAAMATPDYAERASRLARSCRDVGVPFIIVEVPSVDRSISEKGSSDPTHTKSNFVHSLLDEHQRPILYVDVDCVFTSYPTLIRRIAGNADFAIYNWFADEHTDGFDPVDVRMASGEINHRRFYQFAQAVDHYAPEQLTCSGCVQFWGNTAAARQLLARWHETIRRFPGSADDPCLDFAFNNYGREIGVSPVWLPKAYARYPWWIYVKPVVDHPERTSLGTGFKPIPEVNGQKRYYLERAEVRREVRLFPRDCIIDVEERMVLKPVGDKLVPISPTDQNFWIG